MEVVLEADEQGFDEKGSRVLGDERAALGLVSEEWRPARQLLHHHWRRGRDNSLEERISAA